MQQSYRNAILSAIEEEMERNENVVCFGIGVPDHKAVFGSTLGLQDKFGKDRVFDMPLAEDSMMGFALGASINGLVPIYTHMRMDFLLLAMNQLVNMVSNYTYTHGRNTPMVIRAIVGRGWGQGMQHSKSLHSYFAHIPGLLVAIPTTPNDAKGLMLSSLRGNAPVVFIEHRWLYDAIDEVGDDVVPFGKAKVIREGNDLTIVATSWMVVEALKAADVLARHGFKIEVIDPRTLVPLDVETICNSVARTRRCIIADNDWVDFGASSELATVIYNENYDVLKHHIVRVGFAHTPCPTTRVLENEFYPNAITIIREVERMFDLDEINLDGEDFYSYERKFTGPF